MNFTSYPAAFKNLQGPGLYADIANHCERWSYYRVDGSQVTSAHEATHGINSQIRNAAGGRNSGFYLGDDRSIVVPEPGCRKADIIPFIPNELRLTRYNLYIAGQQAWDDLPLYVFDEWVAYINGAYTALDLDARGQYRDGNRDNLYAPIEFISYGVAVAQAAQRANSLSDTLKDFTRFLVRRSLNAFYIGNGKWPFGEDAIVAKLVRGDEGATIRQFCQQTLNFTIPSERCNELADNSPVDRKDFNFL